MMLIQAFFVTVLVLDVVATAGQEKPNFSGEWILNRPASTLSPGADAVQSGVVRIEHREPVFRCKATLTSGGSPFEYAYELVSDGREVEGTQQGRATVSSLRWDGDALVFTGRIQRSDAEVKISFSIRATRQWAPTSSRGTGPGKRAGQDNVWIFERR